MAENKFILCFNALEQQFFEVNAIHLVDDPYRKNFYQLSLRLNFFEGDIDLDQANDVRQLCLRKITNLMTTQKIWQNHHSFYVVQYEIRMMARKSNNLIQQNHNEKDEDIGDHNEANDSMSTVNTHESSSDDSAYGSPSDSDESTALNRSNDSIHYWEDETLDNIDGNASFSDID
jgi:hypothetical protein